MSCNNNPIESLAAFTQSLGKLETLEKMTADLEREISDSQTIMEELKTMFQNVPNASTHQVFEGPQSEVVFRFLEAPGPQFLLPDMEETKIVEIDSIVASMKSYAETAQNNLQRISTPDFRTVHADDLDLTSCAKNLDQLRKNLANIKISVEEGDKHTELEGKLAHLCEDVTMFKQMVDVTERLQPNIPNNINSPHNGLVPYMTILSKFLIDINEVTILLQNNYGIGVDSVM